MSGIRARSLATVGRALFELRRVPAAKEEFFRHVELPTARSFGSFLDERFSRQFVAKQFLFERRTNILPQVWCAIGKAILADGFENFLIF